MGMYNVELRAAVKADLTQQLDEWWNGQAEDTDDDDDNASQCLVELKSEAVMLDLAAIFNTVMTERATSASSLSIGKRRRKKKTPPTRRLVRTPSQLALFCERLEKEKEAEECSITALESTETANDLACHSVHEYYYCKTSTIMPGIRQTIMVTCDEAAVLLLCTNDVVEIVVVLTASVNHEWLAKTFKDIVQADLDSHDEPYSTSTCLERLPLWEQDLQNLIDTQPKGIKQEKGKNSESTNNGLLLCAFSKLGIQVGTIANEVHLWREWWTRNATWERPAIQNKAKFPLAQGATCMICFDHVSVHAPVSHLHPCGHTVCAECLVGYWQSVASQGSTACLPCPCRECLTVLDFLDATHVLVGMKEDLVDSPHTECTTLWRRLLRNELEHVATQSLGARFCPQVGCGNLLVPINNNDTSATTMGWNILHCPCGQTICADCSLATHPGMSCERYSQLRKDIDSGKADAEYASNLYLMQFSRPCPQCGTAIEKDGGCNHMRCPKCNVYFCWQCGGEGQKCNAFYCFGTGRDHTVASALAGDDRVFHKVQNYRNYRRAEHRLKQMDRIIQQLGNASPQIQVERQLSQAALWLHALLLDSTEECEELRRLEFVMQALEARRPSNSHFKPTGKPKHVSKRKQQALGKRYSTESPEKEFADLLMDLELKEIFSKVSLEEVAGQYVHSAVNFIYQQSKPTTNKPAKSRPPKKDENIEVPVVEPLNRKGRRSRAPWRNGMRKEEQADADVARGFRWKGRTKNKSRRALALEKSQCLEN